MMAFQFSDFNCSERIRWEYNQEKTQIDCFWTRMKPKDNIIVDELQKCFGLNDDIGKLAVYWFPDTNELNVILENGNNKEPIPLDEQESFKFIEFFASAPGMDTMIDTRKDVLLTNLAKIKNQNEAKLPERNESVTPESLIYSGIYLKLSNDAFYQDKSPELIGQDATKMMSSLFGYMDRLEDELHPNRAPIKKNEQKQYNQRENNQKNENYIVAQTWTNLAQIFNSKNGDEFVRITIPNEVKGDNSQRRTFVVPSENVQINENDDKKINVQIGTSHKIKVSQGQHYEYLTANELKDTIERCSFRGHQSTRDNLRNKVNQSYQNQRNNSYNKKKSYYQKSR